MIARFICRLLGHDAIGREDEFYCRQCRRHFCRYMFGDGS